MHKVSGNRAANFAFPQAFSCLGEKASGTAVGDFTKDRSQRGCTPSGRTTCLRSYTNPKSWNKFSQTQGSVQDSFSPCKSFFIPLASCLPVISPPSIGPIFYYLTAQKIKALDFFLPTEAQVKRHRTICWQEEVVEPSSLSASAQL